MPRSEILHVSELLATKLIENEFAAYLNLQALMASQDALSKRGYIIASYALCGFANLGSLGIQIGVLSALAPELARKPVGVRRRIEALQDAYRERLLPFVPGETREEKLTKCRLLFSSMAGVLMMARMTSDPQRREQRLMEARVFFIKGFVEE